jgi:hypothetical protein
MMAFWNMTDLRLLQSKRPMLMIKGKTRSTPVSSLKMVDVVCGTLEALLNLNYSLEKTVLWSVFPKFQDVFSASLACLVHCFNPSRLSTSLAKR